MPSLASIYINIALFFVLNSLTGISAFILSKIFFKKVSLDFLIAFILLFISQSILTELVLGIAGKLNLANLIAVNVLICVVLGLLNNKRVIPSIEFQSSRVDLFKNKLVLFCLAFILGFALPKIFINLVNPPFGWDCLNYHFTYPVEWLKHANLDMPITINDDLSPPYYPINGSLLYLWLMFPFKNVMLADLGQIPFFILAFLACFSVARKLGLSDAYSFFAAALFTLVPNYFKQVKIAYVDVMVAALFMSALNYLFLLKERVSLKNVILFSLSLGLFLGTKTIALPYSVLLILPFLFLTIRNFKVKESFASILVFIIFVLIMGGFSYIRNFIQTGNPLYPLDFELFGLKIFKGVMSKAVYAAHFKPQDYSLTKLLFHEGTGIQTLVFLIPAIFLSIPAVVMKKNKNLNGFLLYFLLLPFLIFLIWRYVIPLANVRYLYSFFALGFIIALFVADTLGIFRIVVNILVFICVVASVSELAGHLELGVSMFLSLAIFCSAIFLPKYTQKIKFKFKAIHALFVLLIFTLVLGIMQRDYLKNEYPRYISNSRYWKDATSAWNWLNNNTRGNNIAYVGRPVPFPLYGTDFKNNVYYVSVNKVEPAKLHYFPNAEYAWGYDFESLHKDLEEPNNYRGNANYADWLKNLTQRNTDYLFIYSLHQTKNIIFPLEDEWAKNNPEEFSLVFNNDSIRIYRLSKEKI